MGLLGLLGQSEGRVLRYWVDPVNGNNANAGTQAAPFKEIRYATSTVITTARRPGDVVYLYLAPETYTSAEDYIRLDAADWTGGRLIVRCSVAGQKATIANTTPARLIWAIGTCDCTVDIDDIDFTGTLCLEWAGLVTTSQTGVTLIVRSNCTFTKSATTAGDWVGFDSDAKRSRLYVYGCTINGWSSFGQGNGLLDCVIHGVTFNAGSGAAKSTWLVPGSIQISSSSFTWPNSGNHFFQVQATGNRLSVTDCTFSMVSTNAASPIYLQAPPSVSSGVECTIERNSITLTGDGPALHVGTILNDAITRAANDALVGQFASLRIADNEIYNTDNDGGGLRVMVGTDNAVVTGNFIRRGTLGSGTNVHVCYLWGDGASLTDNDIQGQVLLFGPNQTATGNAIVAEEYAILLGGTQGGSTASGGGNTYTVTDNILVAQTHACFSDYAFNGAYPTNLGELVAFVDRNTYVPISPAVAARLTAADTLCTDLQDILDVWQGGWGDSSNEQNDINSQVLSGADVTWHSDLISNASGVLDQDDFDAIRAY